MMIVLRIHSSTLTYFNPGTTRVENDFAILVRRNATLFHGMTCHPLCRRDEDDGRCIIVADLVGYVGGV